MILRANGNALWNVCWTPTTFQSLLGLPVQLHARNGGLLESCGAGENSHFFLIHYVKTIWYLECWRCFSGSQSDVFRDSVNVTEFLLRFFFKRSMDPPLHFWVLIIGSCHVMQIYLDVKIFRKQSWTHRWDSQEHKVFFPGVGWSSDVTYIVVFNGFHFHPQKKAGRWNPLQKLLIHPGGSITSRKPVSWGSMKSRWPSSWGSSGGVEESEGCGFPSCEPWRYLSL